MYGKHRLIRKNLHHSKLPTYNINMVTEAKFEEGLAQLKSNLPKTLNDSISELKSTLIKNLMESNKLLQGEVAVSKDTVTILETELQPNLQYNRQNNFLISGILKEVGHSDGVLAEWSSSKLSVNGISFTFFVELLLLDISE